MSTQRIPRILILVDTSREFARGLLSGFAHYSQIHRPLMFVTPPPFYLRGSIERRQFFSWIDRLTIDGVVLQGRFLSQRIRDLGVPIIALDIESQPEGIPCILSDNGEIGRLGAEHLLDCAMSHYAFCGYNQLFWSEARCESFCKTMEQRGHRVHLYRPAESKAPQSWTREYSLIIEWLDSLPRPLGLMACNDDRGQHILEACKLAGYAIPEEIAVLGADNDQLRCMMTTPPLSSISMNLEKAGYQAAALMTRLIEGKKPRDIIVEPTLVVRRESTDIIAVDDPEVSSALRFIRDHAGEMIQVNDVVGALRVSRRSLYAKFKARLGRSVHDEIVRVRLGRLLTLLSDTNLQISQIAKIMGFPGPDKLYCFFRRETGKTPSQYRKEMLPYAQ
ncbi:MAG: helix-turn-helix domain-containing protein [Planctomycetes bacterium]|nr:helix-turn-helix domain-containing protein [Planctomycetota bacterium]